MKLPDFTNDSGLNQLRQLMGAHKLGNFSPEIEYAQLTIAELERLAGEGIDVKLEDIIALSDGTLAYKDSRILLYIRDVIEYHRGRRNQELPKFHVAHCKTLDQMKRQNRFARYVVATRDDGKFSINRMKNNKVISSGIIELRVCQNCLAELAFEGFKSESPKNIRLSIVERFTIKKFFEIFPKSLFHDEPEYKDDTAPLNAYPDNWDSISRQTKARANWTCSKCKLRLNESQYRQYLHVHHENGQKYDVRDENLKVLCIGCHAEEGFHIHLKNTPDYKKFIELFSFRF